MPDMRIRVVGALIGLLATLTSCSDTSTKAIEITSAMVTSVSSSSLEVPLYTKVIALANGSAEIIDSMGFKDILMGRDIASTDESLKSVPIVSTGHQLVAEKIIALQPELVIIDESVGPLDAIQTIRSTGIKVELINEVWSVGEISSKVRAIAQLIGTPLAGQLLADKIQSTISESAKAVEDSPRIAFLYLRGGNSIYLLGGKGSGADSLITALGGVDVGAAISDTPFSAFSSESFANEDPEILLVMSKGLESVGGVEGLIALPGIAQTRAGKNRAIIAVDDSLLLSFGPRTPNLLIELADAIKQVKR
ncbi:MAG: ABC transporter substrate-binding protein [Actinobacteria bacterium]|nr:ABC transporter substrate-binding protein [Actinomycetota bacterium]